MSQGGINGITDYYLTQPGQSRISSTHWVNQEKFPTHDDGPTQGYEDWIEYTYNAITDQLTIDCYYWDGGTKVARPCPCESGIPGVPTCTPAP